MTIIEQKFMESVPHSLWKIAKELVRANKLEEFRLRREIGERDPLNENEHEELTNIMED